MSLKFSGDYLTENNVRKWNNYSASSFINDSVNNIIIENNIQNKY